MKKKEIKLGGKTLEVWEAKTWREKAAGAAALSGLGEREGIIFKFRMPMRYEFWMKGVNFPLDIIWLRNKEVVEINGNVLPGNGLSLLSLKIYAPQVAVDCVIEVAAGETARLDIKKGDFLE
ncbi:MAG: DUF192 domain-containing protein [Patescibacteria group bacterium]|nr:DUF192 domain-containing protein [Patescibacteria group bacterium]